MSSFNIKNALMGINIVPSGTNETITISSDNRVGIGTSTPSGQLHVVGTGIISSRLGIGTNSPQYSLDVSGTGNFTTLLQNGSNVSISGHTHTSSNITNFNSSVSGLLPVKNIVGSGNITTNSLSGVFTISNSGLIKSDTSGIPGASGITNIVQMTQANYDALASKDPNTIYFIV